MKLLRTSASRSRFPVSLVNTRPERGPAPLAPAAALPPSAAASPRVKVTHRALAGALRGVVAASSFAVLVGCGGGGSTGAPLAPSPSVPPSDEVYSKVPSAEAFALRLGPELLAEGGLVAEAFVGWNPKPGSPVLRPGMKIMFFGHSTSPPAGLVGLTTAGALGDFGDLYRDTGVRWASPDVERRYLPSDDQGGEYGPSSVYLNADPIEGGIALRTVTGPGPQGRRSFLGPFTDAGQNGQGANAHITGTFVAFRQDWTRSDPLQPFAGGKSLRIAARQSLGAVSVGEGDGLRQAKQQLNLTLINPSCQREGRGNLCQLEYLFNTAIVRNGTHDWSRVAWFQEPSLWFDPAQGGMPIIDGSFGPAGSREVHRESGLALYSSYGVASRHEPYQLQVFEARIDFSELQAALRLIASRKLGIPLDQTDAVAIREVFGGAATDPSAWAVLSVGMGQEVYNPQPDRQVSIGGALHELYVGPAD